MATTVAPKVVLKLNVVLFIECGCWVAQCLEHDIAAQASTIRDVKHLIIKTISAEAKLDANAGRRPLESVKPAPQRYWRMFEEGERLAEQEPIPTEAIPPAFMINAMQAEMSVSS
jgi:hypothetical protein